MCGLCALLASLLLSAAAAAEEKSKEGIYGRLGLGYGGLFVDRSTDDPVEPFAFSPESEFAVEVNLMQVSGGLFVAEGFVLGGSVIGIISENGFEYDTSGEFSTTPVLEGRAYFGLVGLTADWFPGGRGGFHVGGTLGAAYLTAPAPDRSPFDEVGGFGGAFSAHLGYDIWIGERTTFGLYALFLDARLSGTHEADGLEGKESDVVRAGGLMLSVGYL